MLYAVILVAILTVVLTASARRGSRVYGVSNPASSREARAVAFAQQTDSLLLSRNYLFRPTMMQNPEVGTSRDIYEFNYYLCVKGDRLFVDMPVEFVSMNIFTEVFDTLLDNYSLSSEDSLRRVLFTFVHGEQEWAVEMVVDTASGRSMLAISAPQGIMRYLGTLSALEK